MFNSKLRISTFDNLPKSYILRKTCGFAQIAPKNCTKLKFCFMRNFRKKYFRFCANCAKKQRKTALKTYCVSCAKIAQKFAKKIFARKQRKFCEKKFSNFVETLLSSKQSPANVSLATPLNHGSHFTLLPEQLRSLQHLDRVHRDPNAATSIITNICQYLRINFKYTKFTNNSICSTRPY